MRREVGVTRRAAVAGALGTAALVAAGPALGRAGTSPNFLFIMADDLGYADLSCYGRTDYQTPVLDRLAAQGIRFTHAYANSAVCTATRVALVTGRYQYRVPVGLHEPLGKDPIGLPEGHPTLPSLLRLRGYVTSLIGKWHVGHLPKFDPLSSGYDEFWGLRGGGVDYFRHTFAGAKDLWDGRTPVDAVGYLTDLLADRAIRTLERRAKQDRPFMISLHFTAPHWPWEGPNDTSESDRVSGSANPVSTMHYDGGSMATYAEMMRSLDANIGRVLTRLSQLGLDDNTVVIFTSDNGGERFSNTWPFSGRKSELLEGGLRIPTIVRWPGLTTPGTTSQEQIMSMDWLPTFLAAAGGTPHPDFPTDGLDIRAAIAGGTLPERTLYWRFGNKAQQAARLGKWKYLQIAGNSFLFDVVADPLERANLKKLHPLQFENLAESFRKWDSTMLHDKSAPSYGFTGEQLADHFDAKD